MVSGSRPRSGEQEVAAAPVGHVLHRQDINPGLAAIDKTEVDDSVAGVGRRTQEPPPSRASFPPALAGGPHRRGP